MTVINYHYNISGQDDAWAGAHGDNLLKMITFSVFFYIDRYSIERFEVKIPNLGAEAKRRFTCLRHGLTGSGWFIRRLCGGLEG